MEALKLDKTIAATSDPIVRPRPLRHGWRFRVGMMLPSSNLVAEADIARMLPEGATVHTTRLRLAGDTQEELLAMTEKVEEAASLLADARVDLMAFHCTGVTTLDPEMPAKLNRRIEESSGVPATSTAEALLAAFERLRAKRIVLISPYIDAVNESEIRFFAHFGIEVIAASGMGIGTGHGMMSVQPGEWYRRALAMRNEHADAYFLSCTAIRATPVISVIERDLRRPVVTSNQALAWHCLRKAGLSDRVAEMGALFQQ